MTSGLVTGAGRGIGRATALALAARGSNVSLLGRSLGDLAEVASEIRALGRTAITVECDVGDPEQVERAREIVEASLGVPDVVIHNAGVVQRGLSIEQTSPAEWDSVITTNLRGPFLVTRAFLPKMRERGSGRHVFVGSISSTIGCPGTASYAASKWGVVGFAKSLAEEIRGSGVVALAVLPGAVDTEMLRGSGFTAAMTAEDVAKTLVFAALDAPSAMNGSAIEMFG